MAGQISSRPKTRPIFLQNSKGSVLEGKWDPEKFQGNLELVKYYEPFGQ